jgi:hypothetical protein
MVSFFILAQKYFYISSSSYLACFFLTHVFISSKKLFRASHGFKATGMPMEKELAAHRNCDGCSGQQ